jgi:tRNA(fMet)-specific endonuclease VapC
VEHLEDDVGLSIHVLCELEAGAALAREPERERRDFRALCAGLEIASPDESFPEAFGRLAAALERRGERIGSMNLLIATAALQAGAALLTANTKHFERVPGLRVLTY